jgi:hypothetical protein
VFHTPCYRTYLLEESVRIQGLASVGHVEIANHLPEDIDVVINLGVTPLLENRLALRAFIEQPYENVDQLVTTPELSEKCDTVGILVTLQELGHHLALECRGAVFIEHVESERNRGFDRSFP